MDKTIKKISGWYSKILSYGGKVTLIKHAILYIPIHILLAISPSKTTLNYIKNATADFFLG